jgi:hypothetical protein
MASGYRGEKIREYLLERGISLDLAEGISIALKQERSPQEFVRLLRGSIREGTQTLGF